MGKSLRNKILLLLVKYNPHIIAFMYIIYNILGLFNVDVIGIGYIAHTAILPWSSLLCLSILLKYCWIHRLPLYYIFATETITYLDYFKNYTIESRYIILIHICLIGILILGYSYYYNKHKNEIHNFFKWAMLSWSRILDRFKQK